MKRNLFLSVSVSGRKSEDAVAKQEEAKNRHVRLTEDI